LLSITSRQKVCCGTIFCAPNGEIAIDMRYLTPCTSCGRTISAPIAAAAEDILMDDLDSEEAETETEATKFSEEDSNLDADDEGFFDRPAVSPESGSCTPPPLMIAT
jgi:hypothetical protein